MYCKYVRILRSSISFITLQIAQLNCSAPKPCKAYNVQFCTSNRSIWYNCKRSLAAILYFEIHRETNLRTPLDDQIRTQLSTSQITVVCLIIFVNIDFCDRWNISLYRFVLFLVYVFTKNNGIMYAKTTHIYQIRSQIQKFFVYLISVYNRHFFLSGGSEKDFCSEILLMQPPTLLSH